MYPSSNTKKWTESQSDASTVDTINTPLLLVTLWPPEPKMDRWIYDEWLPSRVAPGHPEIVSTLLSSLVLAQEASMT